MPKNSIVKWLLGLIITSLSGAVGVGYDQRAPIEPKDEEDEEDKGSRAGYFTALREIYAEGELPCEGVTPSKECGGGVEDLLSNGGACRELAFSMGRCKSEQYFGVDLRAPRRGDGTGSYSAWRGAVIGEAYMAKEGLATDPWCCHNDSNSGSLWCFSLYVNGNQVDYDNAQEACV